MELKILIDDFFFFEKFGNLEFFEGTENFGFFFESNLRSMSPMPVVLRPCLKMKNLEILNFFMELKILIDFFFKQPKKYEPNAPSPKAFFENFLFFFFLF